jgi:hypothetical protein
MWRLRRGWHLRVKPLWRSWRPFVVIGLAATVLVLGTIGFEDQFHYNFSDSLYNAIQLFGFGGQPTTHPNWQLQIARFLGPLIVGYAAIRGLMVLFREQLQLLWFRAVLREHVVVAGLGEVGQHLAIRLCDLGAQVIVIEANPENARVPGLRDRGVSVLTGSALDAVILRRAQVGRAAYLVVSCGHDQVDIEVAMRGRRLRRTRGVLTVFLNLGDPSLWRTIKAPAVAQGANHSARLEPFSLLDSAASLMVEENDPFADPRRSPTVLIAGDRTISQSLALHVARVWNNRERPNGERPRIELLRPGAVSDCEQLASRHPELASICEVSAADSDVESREMAEHSEEAAAVFVAYSDEARGLASALALRAATRHQDVPIVLAVREESGGIAESARASGIQPFAVFTKALGAEFLDRGMNEVMARAAHEEYVRAREAAGETPQVNPSLVGWELLPHSLRQSNRRLVDGIGPKLAEIDSVIVPAPLVHTTGVDFRFMDEELDSLAVLEHRRWRRDLSEEGWRRTEREKDPERLRHPSLVAWEELSDEERQKDREAVLAIPAILARAGYAIERLAPESAPVRVSTVDPPVGQT